MGIVGAMVIATLIIALHVVAHALHKRAEKNAATRPNLALNR